MAKSKQTRKMKEPHRQKAAHVFRVRWEYGMQTNSCAEEGCQFSKEQHPSEGHK